MRPRAGRRRFRILLTALAITLLAAGAIGASMTALSWNNAGGGSMGLPANWSPQQVPTAADDITFNLGGTYTVTSGIITNDTRSHTYRSGNVTLSQTGTHTVTNGVTVGDLAGDNATFTLTTGTLSSAAAVVVGDAGTATGTLRVTDDAADLVTTTTAGDLTVGNSGAGTMNVTGSGLVRVADRFVAGSFLTSSANVTVSGFSVTPPTRSKLEVNGATSTHAIGLGGDVTMNVSSGALVDFDGTLNVAQTNSSTSTLTLSGAGLFPATVLTSGDFNIARNTTAFTAGGTGTVNVNAGGLLNVGGTLRVGTDPDGGNALLHIGTDGAVIAGSLKIDDLSDLDFDDGTLTIDGGTIDNSDPDGLIISGVDIPTLILDNGAAVTLPSVVSGEPLKVGEVASGRLEIQGGSDLSVPVGAVIVGKFIGFSGNMLVRDPGSSLNVPGTIVIGGEGGGFIGVDSGATFSGGVVEIGQGPSASGELTIKGGSTGALSQVFVGGPEAGGVGLRQLQLFTGSTCDLAGSGTALKVWDVGKLHLNNDSQLNVVGAIEILGSAELFSSSITARTMTVASGGTLDAWSGTVTLDDSLLALGEVTVAGGTIEADHVELTGDLSGRGVISGDVRLNAPNAVVRASDGTLTLGDPASGNGVTVVDGLLDVGDDTMVLLDAAAATLGGTVSIAGGRLVAANGIHLSDGNATLTGHGTIEGLVIPVGSIAAEDTGLVIEGTLFGTGTGVTGTRVRFAGNGGFFGGGTIDASVASDSSTVITAIDDLTMGVGSPDFPVINDGINLEGELNVGSSVVTLIDFLTCDLGHRTRIEGGTLASAIGLHVVRLQERDFLSGFGTIDANLAMHDSSVVRVTGPMTIGRPPTGVNFSGGTFNAGANPVELIATSAVALGNTARLASGGSLTCDETIMVTSTGRLVGAGSVVAPAVINSGVVAPGDANLVDPLALSGTYTQDAGGRFEVTVAGGSVASKAGAAASASGVQLWSRMTVAGDATLNGTLAVSLAPGASIATGDTLPILTCALREGFFASVSFDTPYLDNVFDVVYTPTSVLLVTTATTGVDLPPVGDPRDGADDGDVADGAGALPAQFALRLASRNPFGASDGASFEYDVPRGGAPVSIAVFDASGRRLANIVEGARPAGTHRASWDGSALTALPSGVYFLRMDTGAFHGAEKLVLLR
ncbi:MAG: hypothetical protein ACKVU1_14595 [bacterium]